MDDEALAKSLRYETGWVAKDATEQLVAKAKQSDYSSAFCDFLSLFKIVELIETQKNGKIEKKEKVSYKRQHKGWFYASLAGYQLLEAPKARQGARFSYQHAFAEPIIGLHQWVYFRQDMSLSLFWFSEFNPHRHTYLLKQANK